MRVAVLGAGGIGARRGFVSPRRRGVRAWRAVSKSTLAVLVQMPSQEARDAMLASGMEGGMQVSYNRLEDLVRAG